MLLISSLLLLVSCFFLHPCCFWLSFVSYVITVAGLPAIADFPGAVGIPAVAGLHAVAGVLANASPADPAFPILPGVFTYCTVQCMYTVQWYILGYRTKAIELVCFSLLSDYRIVENQISEQGLTLSDYRRSNSQKTTGCPALLDGTFKLPYNLFLIFHSSIPSHKAHNPSFYYFAV